MTSFASLSSSQAALEQAAVERATTIPRWRSRDPRVHNHHPLAPRVHPCALKDRSMTGDMATWGPQRSTADEGSLTLAPRVRSRPVPPPPLHLQRLQRHIVVVTLSCACFLQLRPFVAAASALPQPQQRRAERQQEHEDNRQRRGEPAVAEQPGVHMGSTSDSTGRAQQAAAAGAATGQQTGEQQQMT